MAQLFRISVVRDRDRQDVSTLMLSASSGERWTKRYHGNLFLLFDAEELGIIVEEAVAGRSKKSLKPEAVLDTATLQRLHFRGPELGSEP